MIAIQKLTDIFKGVEPSKREQQATTAAVLESAGYRDQKMEITYLETDLLDSFLGHPFKLHSGPLMQELVESIQENGIIVPLIVRPKGTRWELLAGHNRSEASKQAGMSKVPCIVLDVDDCTAILIVTETNLQQRQSLLPSERAKAYAMQLDALKKQQKNYEKFLEKPDNEKENQNQFHGGTRADSKTTIYRYLKLNNLIPELLDEVDNNALTLNVGGELSYLQAEEQEAVYNFFFEQKQGILTESLAKIIRERSEKKLITEDVLEKLVNRKAKPSVEIKNISLPFKRVSAYIPAGMPKKAQQDYIIDALVFYNEHKDQNGETHPNL